jgi:hypothetical protein
MFGRKKKQSEQLSRLLSVPLPVLIRQVIYDSMLEPAEDIAEALGLPPISDEVSEMEERASQDRLQFFSQLLPFIDSHADIAAKIASAAYVFSDEIDTEEKVESIDLEEMTKLFRLVSLSASVSCISTLFSLDLIHLNGAKHGK